MRTRDVLLITGIDGAEHCAATVAEIVGSRIEIAPSRRAALAALRQTQFAVVIVEESLVESDVEWADQIWETAGLAMSLQFNFAISGCARLAREVKSALARREGELTVARREAAAEIENELKSSVTGMLLQSELALREPTVSKTLEPKLRHLVELAGTIRERLRREAAQEVT